MPLIAGGIALGGSFLGNRSARKGQKRAEAFAREQSQARGGQIFLPGVGNISVSNENVITGGGGPFAGLSGQFADQASGFLNPQGPALDLAGAGITPGGVGGLGAQIGDQSQILQSQLRAPGRFDVNAFAAQQFDRLNSLAARGDETAANKLAGNLFSRGRLGGDDSATGEAFAGLARAQEEAQTSRALQAIGLAGTERDRLFAEQQQGIQNQFGFLNNLQGQQQQGFQQLLGGSAFNQGADQQRLQNAIGFGGAAGSVLQPNFQALTAILNRTGQDQAARAGVGASTAPLLAQAGAQAGQSLGNVFGGLAQGVLSRNQNPVTT